MLMFFTSHVAAPAAYSLSNHSYSCCSLRVIRHCAAASAAAFICGDGSADAVAAATATASAFAIAIADVTATCKVSGDAAGEAYGYAKAAIEAPVWLEAYASSLALAIDCGGTCSAFAESFAVIGKDVFLSAMAETEAKVCTFCVYTRSSLECLDV